MGKILKWQISLRPSRKGEGEGRARLTHHNYLPLSAVKYQPPINADARR
jgi:hypothetical protein